VYLSVVCSGQEFPELAIPPSLAHRIRGALSEAGYASTGKNFTSGKNKGRRVFAKEQREQREQREPT